MQMWPKAVGYGNLNDVYDQDGDSIVARSTAWFPVGGHGLVQAIFPQGTDRKMAARVLRKFADMLDGSQGHKIANMGLVRYDMNFAQRLEGGDVEVISTAREREEWEKEAAKGEEWKKDADEGEEEGGTEVD